MKIFSLNSVLERTLSFDPQNALSAVSFHVYIDSTRCNWQFRLSEILNTRIVERF